MTTSAYGVLSVMVFCLSNATFAGLDLESYEFSDKQMGVPFGITLYAPTEEAAAAG